MFKKTVTESSYCLSYVNPMWAFCTRKFVDDIFGVTVGWTVDVEDLFCYVGRVTICFKTFVFKI